MIQLLLHHRRVFSAPIALYRYFKPVLMTVVPKSAAPDPEGPFISETLPSTTIKADNVSLLVYCEGYRHSASIDYIYNLWCKA